MSIIKLRRDTTDNWEQVNPVLAKDEPGWDFELRQLRIGDGVTAWLSLPVISGARGDTGSTGSMGSKGAPAVTSVRPNPGWEWQLSQAGTPASDALGKLAVMAVNEGYVPTLTVTDNLFPIASATSVLGFHKRSGRFITIDNDEHVQLLNVDANKLVTKVGNQLSVRNQVAPETIDQQCTVLVSAEGSEGLYHFNVVPFGGGPSFMYVTRFGVNESGTEMTGPHHQAMAASEPNPIIAVRAAYSDDLEALFYLTLDSLGTLKIRMYSIADATCTAPVFLTGNAPNVATGVDIASLAAISIACAKDSNAMVVTYKKDLAVRAVSIDFSPSWQSGYFDSSAFIIGVAATVLPVSVEEIVSCAIIPAESRQLVLTVRTNIPSTYDRGSVFSIKSLRNKVEVLTTDQTLVLNYPYNGEPGIKEAHLVKDPLSSVVVACYPNPTLPSFRVDVFGMLPNGLPAILHKGITEPHGIDVGNSGLRNFCVAVDSITGLYLITLEVDNQQFVIVAEAQRSQVTPISTTNPVLMSIGDNDYGKTTLIGDIVNAFSNLIPGKTYYLTAEGSITTDDTGLARLGRALSETELLIAPRI
jgi:hypothetical protein